MAMGGKLPGCTCREAYRDYRVFLSLNPFFTYYEVHGFVCETTSDRLLSSPFFRHQLNLRAKMRYNAGE